MDLLGIFNIFSLLVFVGLGILAALRMAWRFGNFVFYGYPIPVLLKRDIALFGALSMYFGTALIVLVLGFNGLNKEWLWVVPRGLVVLAAMAYWVWVEYHLEDDDKVTKLLSNVHEKEHK